MKSVQNKQIHRNAKRMRQFGQGMTEYIIIVALVAVAAIGVYGFFGQTIRNQVGGIAQEVAGGDASKAIAAAKTSADAAVDKGKEAKGLSTYGNAGSPATSEPSK